jgi:hypothetical protein
VSPCFTPLSITAEITLSSSGKSQFVNGYALAAKERALAAVPDQGSTDRMSVTALVAAMPSPITWAPPSLAFTPARGHDLNRELA